MFELRTRQGVRYYEIKTSEGQVLKPGDVVKRSDRTFQVLSLGRGPEYNGTAKVFVEIKRDARTDARTGMRHDFYDHALGLVVTPLGKCWHEQCVLSLCNGSRHASANGEPWTQEEGTEYCSACQGFHKPPQGSCTNVTNIADRVTAVMNEMTAEDERMSREYRQSHPLT